jgi:hypothetical protein
MKLDALICESFPGIVPGFSANGAPDGAEKNVLLEFAARMHNVAQSGDAGPV